MSDSDDTLTQIVKDMTDAERDRLTKVLEILRTKAMTTSAKRKATDEKKEKKKKKMEAEKKKKPKKEFVVCFPGRDVPGHTTCEDFYSLRGPYWSPESGAWKCMVCGAQGDMYDKKDTPPPPSPIATMTLRDQ